MPQVYDNERSMIDVSFMPSLECNHRCSFCMYRCSPDAKWELNKDRARIFRDNIEWNDVSSIGFYGGEPMAWLPLLKYFILMVRHLNKPMFMITNGAFTASIDKIDQFWELLREFPMRVVISGTSEHKAHQSANVIEILKQYVDLFKIKDYEEEMHPMGRLEEHPWTCSHKCITSSFPSRIAIFPTGHIIYQLCDGVYPVIGTFKTPWKELKKSIVRIRSQGCRGFKATVNDLTKGLV